MREYVRVYVSVAKQINQKYDYIKIKAQLTHSFIPQLYCVCIYVSKAN